MSKKTIRRLGWKEFLLSLFLIFAMWAVQTWFGDGKPAVNLLPSGTAAGAIQVLFTDPQYPDTATDHHSGIDENLAYAMDKAKKTIDIAAFELDSQTIADAMIRAKQRGVRVRMVTDSDYEDEDPAQSVIHAGIPVVFDERDPFMHDKFVVIDGNQVWAGSWNFTDNGTYRNNNNVIIASSKELAENYTREFEEMFVDHKFGASSPDDTPHPKVNINGVQVENYFESEGNVRKRIIELINNAKSSIDFMAFAFTDNDIAKAIRDRAQDGIKVHGVVESRNANGTGSDYEALRKAGVDVLKDGNPYMMHHKVIIIDQNIVITGSYNFTASAANKNDENVLIIHSPALAQQYTEEFKKVYRQAQDAQ